MQINVHSSDFPLTQALEDYARKHVRFAFGEREERIGRIHIRLGDVNGPRGGADKVCKVHVVLPGKPDVFIEDVALDMYVAINRALSRAAICVDRRLVRQRRYRRRPRLVVRTGQGELEATA